MVDFKNIQQVGKPTNTDKIYIENNAYQRIHREEFPERRVFVLMGHTECAPTGYSTYIEASLYGILHFHNQCRSGITMCGMMFFRKSNSIMKSM